MSITYRVVVIQSLLGIACMAVFWLVDTQSARSAGLAVGVSLFPCAYYAWFQTRSFSAARLVAQGMMKTILTMVLMAVAMAVFTIEPAGFFVTLGIMQLSYVIGPLLPPGGGAKRQENRVNK